MGAPLMVYHLFFTADLISGFNQVAVRALSAVTGLNGLGQPLPKPLWPLGLPRGGLGPPSPQAHTAPTAPSAHSIGSHQPSWHHGSETHIC